MMWWSVRVVPLRHRQATASLARTRRLTPTSCWPDVVQAGCEAQLSAGRATAVDLAPSTVRTSRQATSRSVAATAVVAPQPKPTAVVVAGRQVTKPTAAAEHPTGPQAQEATQEAGPAESVLGALATRPPACFPLVVVVVAAR